MSDRDAGLFKVFASSWEGSENKPDPERIRAAFEVFERRELWFRTDEVYGGAVVLLYDAANALRDAALTLFEERATTPDLLKIIKETIGAVEDARLLAEVNPRTTPIVGFVVRLPDGSYRTGSDPEKL